MSVRTKLNYGHAVPRVGCRPAVTRGHCLTWDRKTNHTFTSLCPGVHGVQGDGSSSGGAIWRLLAHGQHRERGARDHCSLCGDSGHPGAQDSCQCPLDVGPEPSWLVTGRIFPAWFPSLSWDGVGQAVQGKRAPDTGTSSPGNSLKDPISQEVLEQHATRLADMKVRLTLTSVAKDTEQSEHTHAAGGSLHWEAALENNLEVPSKAEALPATHHSHPRELWGHRPARSQHRCSGGRKTNTVQLPVRLEGRQISCGVIACGY